MIRTRYVLLLCSLTGVMAVGMFFFVSKHGEPVHRTVLDEHSDIDVKAEAMYWRKRIASVGGAEAYKELAASLAGTSIPNAHIDAHVFGGELYKQHGVPAIFVCDDDKRFTYGCQHEVFSRAIQEHGMEVVPRLVQNCEQLVKGKSNTSCQHSIGHGILSTLGYDEESLEKALAVCHDIAHSHPIAGCYRGVFMEYNVRTMIFGSPPRPFTDGNTSAPCDRLAMVFKLPCTFWQSQWWLYGVFNGVATEETYAAMGDYCMRMARTPTLLRACFEGFGYIVGPSAEYDTDVSIRLCHATSKEDLYRLYCRAMTAADFRFGGLTDKAGKICDGLTGPSEVFCRAYASGKASITEELPAPTAL